MKSRKIEILCSAACLFATSAIALAACAPAVKEPDPEPNAPIEGYSLVWRDEFDGNAIDANKWEFQTGTHDVYHGVVNRTENWGNNELQYYTEDSAKVEDGNLVISAQRRDYEGKEYTSARIITRDRAYFTYGYFEARMKTPAIDGMWPAFWMLPQPTDFTADRNEYGTWAANGEIDIMEAKGRQKNIVGTTLHYGGQWPNNTYKNASYTLQSNTDEWHTYGIDWRADGMTWYIDGENVFSMKNSDWYSTAAPDNPSAPFDVDFYILLNLAVGGNYDNGVKPSDDFTSANMYVDYVRVYQQTD